MDVYLVHERGNFGCIRETLYETRFPDEDLEFVYFKERRDYHNRPIFQLEKDCLANHYGLRLNDVDMFFVERN